MINLPKLTINKYLETSKLTLWQHYNIWV